MDFLTGFIIFITALVAIFFLFMKLSPSQIKRCGLIAAALCTVPLTIVLIGSSFSWSEADFMSVILLQRGISSLIFSIGYGITAGLLLHGLKVVTISLLRKAMQLTSVMSNK